MDHSRILNTPTHTYLQLGCGASHKYTYTNLQV